MVWEDALARRQDPARPVVVADGRRDRRRDGRSIHGQGDGWVRGYEAQTGKKLWEFDLNPKDSVWPKTRNEVISDAGRLRGASSTSRNGQDPEHGEGVGHFYAIDPTKRGDITQTGTRLALRQDPPVDLDRGHPRRHRSTYADFSGFLHALDAKTGTDALDPRHARRRCGARRWSWTARSTWATRTATWSCSQAGKEEEAAGRDEHGQLRLLDGRCRPTARCYIANRNQLWCAGEATP